MLVSDQKEITENQTGLICGTSTVVQLNSYFVINAPDSDRGATV